MAARFLQRSTSLALSVAAMMLASTPRGQAQATTWDRRGGPRDWSHGHLVTAAGGLQFDGRDARDWRTVLKHRRMALSKAFRANVAAFASDAGLEWLTGPTFVKRQREEGAAPDLDWSLRTGGFGNVVGYPAKYSFDITASNCSDVIYFTVNQNGSATAANVIALTNVYIGCTGNPTGATPGVKFALRLPTGTATSAVPSLDGKILYVFESRATAAGPILHAIQVNNITSSPGTYSFTAPGNWTSVHTLSSSPIGTAGSEQLWQLAFANVTNNVSSPFLDYATNQLYFGDSTGKMHRIVNAATSSAAEAANFPVACGTQQLTSPVLANNQVVMGSADGRLYRIDVTGAGPYTCIASAKQGSGTGAAGGLAAPLVDVGNGRIIYVTGEDGLGFGIKGVGMMNLTFASGGTYTSGVSTGQADGIAPATPALDDAFWSNNAGNLYVAGGSTSGSRTYLIRVPYNGTAVSGPSGYASLRNGGASSQPTSPVTEFLTASSLPNPDFLFIGGAGGSYLYMNRISSGFNGTDGGSVSMDSTFAVPGGVMSGISIDTRTTSVTGQATANIYFGTMGVGATTQSTIVQLAQQF